MALSADSLCSKSTLTTSWDVRKSSLNVENSWKSPKLKWLYGSFNRKIIELNKGFSSKPHLSPEAMYLATRCCRCFQGMDWLLRTPPTHRFWPEKRTGHGATPSLSMSRWSLGLWKIISSASLGPMCQERRWGLPINVIRHEDSNFGVWDRILHSSAFLFRLHCLVWTLFID